MEIRRERIGIGDKKKDTGWATFSSAKEKEGGISLIEVQYVKASDQNGEKVEPALGTGSTEDVHRGGRPRAGRTEGSLRGEIEKEEHRTPSDRVERAETFFLF